MPGLVLCKWLELRAAKGRGTLDSYSCVVPAKLNRNVFSYHTIAALLVLLFFENFPSAFVGPWLPIPDSYWAGGTVLQYGHEAELRWYRYVQILSKKSSIWFLVLKLVDAALKGSFCLGSCLNCEDAADSSPDAPQCQGDVLAISAADLFV